MVFTVEVLTLERFGEDDLPTFASSIVYRGDSAVDAVAEMDAWRDAGHVFITATLEGVTA